jgi:hypothetical protein
MATSQRLNAFSNDLDCMWRWKCWFKLFCRRRSFVIELSKLLHWLPVQ